MCIRDRLNVNNRNKDNDNKFESSLNFEPNTTPIPNSSKSKNRVRIMEADRISVASLSTETADLNNDDERKNTSRKFSRKISEMGSSQEWDNISQHNIEAFSVPNPSSLEEEKEPTGQRTSHQNANKV